MSCGQGPEEPWALDPALTNSSSHLTDTGEESAKANSDSDPTLSAPFERAAALCPAPAVKAEFADCAAWCRDEAEAM